MQSSARSATWFAVLVEIYIRDLSNDVIYDFSRQLATSSGTKVRTIVTLVPAE